jgi:uncharacterized membrane protein YbhN (UPF0104 family)
MIKKIVFLILVMLILSYLGQMISARIYLIETQSFLADLILIKNNFIFILGSNLLLYFLEMWRLDLIGKSLKLNFSKMDLFGSIALNLLFGWISPSAILGAPAMVYFLHKRGYSLAAAITASFVRSFTIILVSALTTIVIFSGHYQGTVANIVLQQKIFQVLIFIAIYISSLIALSFSSFAFIKKINFLVKITTQIRIFIIGSKFLIVPIILMTLAMNFILVSFIPFLLAHYYSQMAPLIAQTYLFLSYLLLMPTPGATGLAEVGAPMFFQGVVPVNEVISTVTAMRISTISLQVTVGVLFMIFFLKDNITFAELKKFKS